MTLDRRTFLHFASAFSTGIGGLRKFQEAAPAASPKWKALGELVPDPEKRLDLPAGFTSRAFSLVGEEMDDGLLVPPRHDGMAAFARADGRTVLVRNHENLPGPGGGAFGATNELLEVVDPAKVYDIGRKIQPCLGGTTTLVFDTRTQKLEQHWLSLAGTLFNCCGGPTPWGSWISCEENTTRANAVLERDHGYAFEVPAAHEGLIDPQPLAALGRFQREAVAIDPRTGIVYMTEDREDSVLFRFVPERAGELARGRLQALTILGAPSLDARNWHDLTHVELHRRLETEWVDLKDIDAPEDDLRYQAFLKGAARFARGEGIWFGNDSAYFCCTDGGRSRKGQVWRYVPSASEGTPEEANGRGSIELFLEPDDPGVLENCDNLTVAPWGHLFLCEDGPGANHLVGVTQEGEPYLFAKNAWSPSELAGATFSPDGTTLFVNLQLDGVTLAITGPWEKVQAI